MALADGRGIRKFNGRRHPLPDRHGHGVLSTASAHCACLLSLTSPLGQLVNGLIIDLSLAETYNLHTTRPARPCLLRPQNEHAFSGAATIRRGQAHRSGIYPRSLSLQVSHIIHGRRATPIHYNTRD